MTTAKPPPSTSRRPQLVVGLLVVGVAILIVVVLAYQRGDEVDQQDDVPEDTRPQDAPAERNQPDAPEETQPEGAPAEPEDAPKPGPEAIACAPLWEEGDTPEVHQTQGGDVTFAGYHWHVRDYDGGPTSVGTWAAEQVGLEGENLRLRLSQFEDGLWRSAEVYSVQEGFGYGTYRWRIESNLTGLDPSVVLGLFTYERDAPGNREIDIEVTQWADASRHNAHVTRHQADGFEARSWQLETPDATEHAFRWQEGEITWCSRDASGAHLFATQLDTDLTPGDERVHMNLWIYGEQAPEQPAEVVISDFEFSPSAS